MVRTMGCCWIFTFNLILFMGESRVGRKSGQLSAFLYFSEEICFGFLNLCSLRIRCLLVASIDKFLVLVDQADMKSCSTCSFDPF